MNYFPVLCYVILTYKKNKKLSVFDFLKNKLVNFSVTLLKGIKVIVYFNIFIYKNNKENNMKIMFY